MLGAVSAAACGSGPGPTHTPSSHTPTDSATPAPTRTAAPDTLAVLVTATGVGSWQLVAVPVAVLVNQAQAHGATGVVVHFTTKSAAGTPLHELDSVAVNLPPRATLIVTADCTETCSGSATATASVTVGGWVESSGILLSGSGLGYRCSAGCGGPESGDVLATLSAVGPIGASAVVTSFADCVDAHGAIVGGGSVQVTWSGSPAMQVDVPVVLRARPASCSVSGSTGW